MPVCGWFDAAQYGVIECTGTEVGDLLHRISTNTVQSLPPQAATRTVLVTEKGRTIDVITVLREHDRWLLLTSPGMGEAVFRWIRHFVVMEDVRLRLCSEEFVAIELWAPRHASQPLLPQLIPDVPYTECGSGCIALDGVDAWCIYTDLRDSNSGVHIGDCMLVLVPQAAVDTTRQWLMRKGVAPLTGKQRQLLRICARVGCTPAEYNESYIPFEAGLGTFVALGKGCYVGQEVIERIYTQRKLRWVLCSLSAEHAMPQLIAGMKLVDPGSGEEIGVVTSAADTDEQCDGATVGLGYVRAATFGGDAPEVVVHSAGGYQLRAHSLVCGFH